MAEARHGGVSTRDVGYSSRCCSKIPDKLKEGRVYLGLGVEVIQSTLAGRHGSWSHDCIHSQEAER